MSVLNDSGDCSVIFQIGMMRDRIVMILGGTQWKENMMCWQKQSLRI